MTFMNQKELEGLWTAAKKQLGKEFQEAEDEEKVITYLDKLSQRKLQKAYTYKRGIPIILKVIGAELKITATAEMRRLVKNWATNRARESSQETLQFPNVSMGSSKTALKNPS